MNMLWDSLVQRGGSVMMVRSDLDVSTRDARCKCGLLCQGEREVKAKENELMEMYVVVIELIVQGTIKWATVITFLWRSSKWLATDLRSVL